MERHAIPGLRTKWRKNKAKGKTQDDGRTSQKAKRKSQKWNPKDDFLGALPSLLRLCLLRFAF
jgi:hypothetical protein